jgi:hypothetical protein
MSWKHAQALAALDTCAINCGLSADCAAKYCTYQVNKCTSE